MALKSNWIEMEDRRIEVIRWLAIAMKDRGMADVAISFGFLEHAAYCLQQSTEKLLKSFLIANAIPLDKTHNIDSLLISTGKLDHRILNLDRVGIGSSRLTELATYYCYPNLDKNDQSEFEEAQGAAEFSDAVYNHLSPFFGDSILLLAQEHARLEKNPFGDMSLQDQYKYKLLRPTD